MKAWLAGLSARYHGMWLPNFDRLWYRLWSIRLNIVGVLFDTGDFVSPFIMGDHPQHWLLAVGIVFHVGAMVARGFPQHDAKKAAADAAAKAAQ